MAKASKMLVAAGALAACHFLQTSFVPPAGRGAQMGAAAGTVAMLGAAPAYADKIDDAAKKLSEASYPFLKDIDWLSDIYLKPLPGQTAPATMKAIDKMIVMGSKMDGAALQEAAKAHVKAIEGMDGKGVLKQSDFEAVLAGLGKAISSVPTSTVMGVYSEIGKLVGGPTGAVPTYVLSKQNKGDAMAAYQAVIEFKDSVEAAQPRPTPYDAKPNDPLLIALGVLTAPALLKVLGMAVPMA